MKAHLARNRLGGLGSAELCRTRPESKCKASSVVGGGNGGAPGTG